MQNLITERIRDIRGTLINHESFNESEMLSFTKLLIKALNSGQKIAFVGNGGSAAEAMHIAAEFTGKCVFEHRPVAALCLNESISSITAIANDFGFEEIFARQVEAMLNEGDILVALSTSGQSKNILKALEVATRKKVITYLWTGRKEIQIENVNVWNVPSDSTPRIQEVHLMWGHIISEVFEIELNNLDKNRIGAK